MLAYALPFSSMTRGPSRHTYRVGLVLTPTHEYLVEIPVEFLLGAYRIIIIFFVDSYDIVVWCLWYSYRTPSGTLGTHSGFIGFWFVPQINNAGLQ